MLLVFCGYVTNDHKAGGFEQHKLSHRLIGSDFMLMGLACRALCSACHGVKLTLSWAAASRGAPSRSRLVGNVQFRGLCD